MKKIENKTRVIVDESAIDKILALRPESVVLVKGAPRLGGGMLTTVVHRTGADGWLVTRTINAPAKRSGSEYHSTEVIKAYLQRAEKSGSEFFLLYDPAEDAPYSPGGVI